MAMSAETSNSCSPYQSNETDYFYDCYSIPHTKKIGITIATMIFLMGLPLNMWQLLQFAKSLCGGMVETDIFVINITFIQTLYCLVNPVIAVNMYMQNQILMYFTLFVSGIMMVGWSLFQSCICVKRYLAVVHPLVFLKIRSPKYLKYQVMCWGSIWLVTLGFCVSLILSTTEFPDVALILPFTLVLVLNTFCCLSIIRVLKRPAPGDSEKEGMHKRNRQALMRVLITQLLVTLDFLPYICTGLMKYNQLPFVNVCIGYAFSYAAIGVTTIVQPLLSLNQMGTLPSQVCSCLNLEQTG